MNHKCKWTPLVKKSKVKICHTCGAIWAPGGIRAGNTVTLSPVGVPNAIDLDNTTTPPAPVANKLRLAGEGGATGRVMHIDLSTAPSDGQALVFSAATGKWQPGTPTPPPPPPSAGTGFIEDKIQFTVHDWTNWEASITGTGVVTVTNNLAELRSGSVSGGSAVISRVITNARGLVDDNFSFDQTSEIQFHIFLPISTFRGTSQIHIANTTADIEATNIGFGFRIDDNALKGVYANGTTLTVVDLVTILSAGVGYIIRAKLTAGTKIEWFVNGVLKGSATAGLPAGSVTGVRIVLGARNNADNANQGLRVRSGYFTER
jgi:hypothetical protein